MTSDLWNRARTAFNSVAELPLEERSAALARIGDEAPDVALEVRRLLDNLERAQSFLETPVLTGLDQVLAPSATLEPGASLANRYEIRSFLGAGGMGEVYAAWDGHMGIKVALKILPPPLSSPEMIERFLREVHLARAIAHPGICKTYDLGKDTGRTAPLYFLSMEFIEGETLAQRLARDGAPPPPEAQQIMMEAIDAVAAAHHCGVVHRDLKPGNVMVRREATADGYRVALMDFGLAKTLAPAAFGPHTTELQQLGTPQYMAPEQLSNEPATKATDVYALGLTAFEVLSGRRPLGNEAPLAALIKRAQSVPPELSSGVERIPPLWNSAIARCLQPDPKERFENAGELALALRGKAAVGGRVPFAAWLTRRKVMITAGMAIAATGGGYLVSAARMRRDARVAAGTAMLLVPVVNDTHEAEFDGLKVAFTAEIQQSAHLTFSQPGDDPEQLKLVLKAPGERLDARTARHLALRGGIPLVLFGALTRVGSEYLFNIVLERVQAASEQAAASWPQSFRAAAKADIHTALYDAALWVRRTTGESEASIADLGKRPEEVTTDSWDALREFSKAEAQADGDLPGAVISLQAATRRDPQFAMAYMRLSDYLIRLNRFGEGYGAWASAIAALDKRPISRREELMIRSMHADDLQDFSHAVAYYKELMQIYPHFDFPWRYMSSPLMKLGLIDESVARYQEYIAYSGGTRWTQWRKLLDYAAIGGQLPLAAQAWEEMKRHAPPDGQTELAAFMLHAASGESEAAEAALRAALGLLTDANRSKYATTLAHWLADRERYDDAAQILRDRMKLDANAGMSAERARKLVSWALIEARISGKGVVRPACLEAIELDRGPQRVRKAAVALARHGFREDAVRAKGYFEVAAGEPLARVAGAVVDAEISLNRGDGRSALRALDEVSLLRSRTDSRLEVARALAFTGDRRRAQDVLEDSLRFRHAEWAAADLSMPMDYRDARALLAQLKSGAKEFSPAVQ